MNDTVEKKLRVVFFGTPAFAAELLETLLLSGIHIAAVVTKPDRPKGRSDKLIPSEVKVKSLLLAETIPILQPSSAKEDNFFHSLAELQPDLFVVVAYGEIIQQRLLDLPTYGAINVHASILPKYRGAAPIQRSIIDGETETGVTIMRMVRKMDAGEIIKIAKVKINSEMTYGELEKALCNASKEPLLTVIDQYASKTPPILETQNENFVTFAAKIELEECQINWHDSAVEIHNLVRGVNPHPGAWCFVTIKGEKKRLKIHKTHVIEDQAGQAGTLLVDKSPHSIIIACGNGALDILELQLEGKRRMTAQQFLQGTLLSDLEFKRQ